MTRLSIFMSHPIQYQVSLLKKISAIKGVDLEVFYFWDFGLKKTYDNEFRAEIQWDVPLLSGYSSTFLRNFSWKKNTSFWGCINPGVISTFFKGKHDVVLVFGWAIFSNWLIIALAIMRSVPIMLISEAPLSHENFKKGIRKWIRKGLLDYLFCKVDLFLYIGEDNRLFYKSFNVPDDKLIFCPYAVDNEMHQSGPRLPKNAELLSKKVSSENVLVLFVGKLIPKKRPLDLLKAFELLKNKAEVPINLELWFVGDGELREECEQYIKVHHLESVKIWGFQNQLQLPIFYSAADIFVLPSGVGETWGLVVNEAMCHGKPIICSHLVGCAKDLVTPSNGMIFEFGNVSQLASCIEFLAFNRSLRRNYGNESLRIIRGYDQSISARSICDAAQSINGVRNGT
jgi:glycosyltransferase involved in cell wall biosynthesis